MSLSPPEADIDQEHPRQRASRACIFCHSRKVKCDALRVYPCTRCKESHLQCTLRVSHRGRTRRITRTESRVESRAPRSARSVLIEPRAGPVPNPRRTDRVNPSSSSVDLIRSLENFIDNPNSPIGNEDGVSIVHATNNNAFTSILNAAADTDENSRRNLHLYAGSSTNACSAMDRYREAIGRLDAPTRKFLAEKGVFDLPDAHLADNLIQNFFDYADPHVPIIDKTDFLERYKARNVPPLLLQSVMFVGSHFALDEHVAASPWPTRTEMTAGFFEKAKLIADFELERDQITLVQCFVLLAERWFGWTEERNTRYWMSRAINVAYMMGLHRKIETLNLTPAQKRLWNRVAWVTMAKDCFVAAMFGTPTIIDDRWTDREELIWDSSYFDESRDDQGVDSAPSRTPETVNYSTALVWLGALVGMTINKLHSIPNTSEEPLTSAVLDELRERMDQHTADYPSLIDMELQDTTTTPKSQLIYRPLLRAAHSLVALFYHWALAEKHKDPEIKLESRQTLHHAAYDFCEVMSYLRAHSLFPICPLWLVAGVFHTMAVLLSDCRDALLGSEEPRKSGSFGRLRQLNEDLSILEKTWKPAGWFRELIRISLSKLQERVRKRKEGQARTPEPERQPQQGGMQSVPEGPIFCESPGVLFESARELFPDLENVFNWTSADTFILS